MSYQIIQPPFSLVFREMPKTELKNYYEWYLKGIPDRVRVLATAVDLTLGYETWVPNCSPESLEKLGEWFFTQVEARQATDDVGQVCGLQSASFANTSAQLLTNKSLSLAMDIGMYVSQVFLKNHSSVGWSQPFGPKKFIDYGQPVLIGFGPAPFNPTRMMVTLAYGFVNHLRTKKSLRELYGVWSNLASAAGANPKHTLSTRVSA